MDLVKIPYRVLIQFGPDSEVQGVSFQDAEVLVGADGIAVRNEDGAPKHWVGGAAAPASPAPGGKGWPIAEVVAQHIADGLLAAAPKLADYDAKVADLTKMCEAYATLQAAHQQALAQIAAASEPAPDQAH